jgi:hypothetical protein
VLLFGGVIGVLALLLWVFCIFDAITSDAARVRNLPKLLWVVIVVVLVDIGSLLWLLAGRPRGEAGPKPVSRRGVPPEYDRPGRAAASSPDDDAAFLAQLKERAERQRAQAEEQARRRAEGEATPGDSQP